MVSAPRRLLLQANTVFWPRRYYLPSVAVDDPALTAGCALPEELRDRRKLARRYNPNWLSPFAARVSRIRDYHYEQRRTSRATLLGEVHVRAVERDITRARQH